MGMSLSRPALDPATLPPRSTSSYPEVFRERVLPREKRALGDAFGLTTIGVNHTTLTPGKQSALRHFHTTEDELIFVLAGEVVLVTNAGEQRLTAGMCVGFTAGVADGHCLWNRSDAPAVYLEISNRDPDDNAIYPDDDLLYRKGEGGAPIFTRKDGSSYEPSIR
jgi:uncharacterized cupin superfamily protein